MKRRALYLPFKNAMEPRPSACKGSLQNITVSIPNDKYTSLTSYVSACFSNSFFAFMNRLLNKWRMARSTGSSAYAKHISIRKKKTTEKTKTYRPFLVVLVITYWPWFPSYQSCWVQSNWHCRYPRHWYLRLHVHRNRMFVFEAQHQA